MIDYVANRPLQMYMLVSKLVTDFAVGHTTNRSADVLQALILLMEEVLRNRTQYPIFSKEREVIRKFLADLQQLHHRFANGDLVLPLATLAEYTRRWMYAIEKEVLSEREYSIVRPGGRHKDTPSTRKKQEGGKESTPRKN